MAPIERVQHEIQARHQLDVLASHGLMVGAAEFVITVHEVDDEGVGGIAIVYGQWDEQCVAIRIGRAADEITQAHILRGLGPWEQAKTGALVEPPREGVEVNWPGDFDIASCNQGEE